MATKPEIAEMNEALAAKAAEIPILRDVRLQADYIPARLPTGMVIGITGDAVIRTPEGDLRALKVGDEIRKGDVILTSQDGIVEMNAEGSRLARAPEGLDQILMEAPAAGLSGGDPGSLQPGLRIARLNEGTTGQSFGFDGAEGSAGPSGDALLDANDAAALAAPNAVVPALTIADTTIGEGSGFAIFTVTVTQPVQAPLTLTLETGAPGDSATTIDDYGPVEVSLDDGATWTTGSTATLPPGTTDLLVRVAIVPDNLDEPDETFTLIGTLTDPATGQSGGGSGIATITDDDPTPTVVTVTPTDPDADGDAIADVPEGTGTPSAIDYAVVLSNPSSRPVSFDLSLAGADTAATDPLDPASDLGTITVTFPGAAPVTVNGGTITVPPGVTSFTVTILTNPDGIDENNETFGLTVGGVTSLVTVVDDDATPVAASTTIAPLEEGAALNLGLAAATDADPGTTLAITVTALPTIGTIQFADGTPVTLGATLSNDQLVGLRYLPPADYVPGTPVGDFVYTVSDGINVATGRTTIDLQAVNDAPVANNDALAATEDTVATYTAAQLLGNDSDVDNPAGDLRIASVGSAVGGTVVLNADGTVTFTPAPDFNGSASFTYFVSDGAASSVLPATVTVAVAAVNDPTEISLDGTDPTSSPPATYVENAAPEALAPAMSLRDVDSATLSGATVRIGTGLVAAEDRLSFTAANGITGSYDVASGVLTLSGNATLAQYEQVLRSVSYANLSEDPSNAARTVTFTVTDDLGLISASKTLGLTVVPVNDAPIANADAVAAVEDTVATFTAAQLLGNDSDVDDPASALRIASVANPVGGNVVLNADGTVTFTPTPDFNGNASFTYFVNDGTTNSLVPATVTVTVAAVNDAPVIALDGVDPASRPAVTYTESTTAQPSVQVLAPALDLSDVDSPTLSGATVHISAGLVSAEDSLSFTAANGITGSYNATTGVLSLSGNATQAQYEQVLRTVAYSNSSNAPGTGPRTISYTVVDDLGLASAIKSQDLTVVPTNDAPTVTVPTDATGFIGAVPEDDLLSFSGALALRVNDVDGAATVLTTTVTVSQGTLTLSNATPSGVTLSGQGSSAVTLVGTAADINAALATMGYRDLADHNTHAAGAPFSTAAGIGLGITVSDGVATSSASAQIAVTAVVDTAFAGSTTIQGVATAPFSLATLKEMGFPNAGFESADARIVAINDIPLNPGESIVVANGVAQLTAAGELVFVPNPDYIVPATAPEAAFQFSVLSGGVIEKAAFLVQVDPLPGATTTTATTTAATTVTIQAVGTQDSEWTATPGQSDVFAWHLADAGSDAAPRTTTIHGFDTAPASAGGDVLDLRDVLPAAHGDLGALLDFSRIGNDTVVSVNSDGQGSANLHIVLQGVDLAGAVGAGAGAGEAQLIAALVAQGKLLTDNAAA